MSRVWLLWFYSLADIIVLYLRPFSTVTMQHNGTSVYNVLVVLVLTAGGESSGVRTSVGLLCLHGRPQCNGQCITAPESTGHSLCPSHCHNVTLCAATTSLNYPHKCSIDVVSIAPVSVDYEHFLGII